MTLRIQANFNKEAADALMYLLTRWHDGQSDKRNSTMSRALIETARREAAQELAERKAG